MSEISNECTLNVVELLNVTKPPSGGYNEHIRGIYNWRNTYSGSNLYYVNDVVEYNSSQYIRISEIPGSEVPTDSTWQELPGTKSFKRDLQSITLTNNVTWNSSVYTDLPGMSLTTKDLDGNGTYKIAFSAVAVTNNNNSNTISFKLQRNGIDVTNQVNDLRQYGSENSTANIICVVNNVSNGDIFKIQWKRTNGTANCTYRSLVIDGNLSSNIV